MEMNVPISKLVSNFNCPLISHNTIYFSGARSLFPEQASHASPLNSDSKARNKFNSAKVLSEAMFVQILFKCVIEG